MDIAAGSVALDNWVSIFGHICIGQVTTSPPYLGISIFGHSYRDLHKWTFLQCVVMATWTRLDHNQRLYTWA